MAGRSRSGPRLPSSMRVHGDVRGDRLGAWESVYRIARRIPRGRVMTYGQIASLLHDRLSPRAVGWAMHGCPPGVPWQRVVNASGGCSTERLPDVPPGLQQAMLEAEGISFSKGGNLDLSRYRFVPEPPRRRARSAPGGSRPGRRRSMR